MVVVGQLCRVLPGCLVVLERLGGNILTVVQYRNRVLPAVVCPVYQVLVLVVQLQ